MKLSETIFLEKKIIGVSHFSMTGFTQHMEEYLINKKVKKCLTIEHPLHTIVGKSKSEFRLYKNGKIDKKGNENVSSQIEVINYIKSTILTLLWVIKTGEKWDLLVGNNGLNTLAGIILRKIGRVEKVVFYSVDFVPHRFKNKLMNSFYHWVDKISIIYSDEVWVLSPRMIEGRRKLLKINKKYDSKQILFPEGVWLNRIKKEDFKNIQKHTAIFSGSLIPRMGIHHIIRSIPTIIKTIPDFKLIITGKGDYEKELEELTIKTGVEKHVSFKGFIENHKDLENLIASCALGFAIYTEDKSGLTYYADPSKTKLYLGAGIPVIMTDAFYNAYDIENAGAGIVTKDDPKNITKAVIEIMSNEKTLQKYKKNAIEFAKQFDWSLLFYKNLSRLLK